MTSRLPLDVLDVEENRKSQLKFIEIIAEIYSYVADSAFRFT